MSHDDPATPPPFTKLESRDFFVKLTEVMTRSIREMNDLSTKQLHELRDIRSAMDQTHVVNGKLLDAIKELTHEIKQSRKEAGKNGSSTARALRRG